MTKPEKGCESFFSEIFNVKGRESFLELPISSAAAGDLTFEEAEPISAESRSVADGLSEDVSSFEGFMACWARCVS